MTRHETDVVSLGFAIVFIGIGASFLTGTVNVTRFLAVWALPMGFLATGIILGAAALTRYHRRQENHVPPQNP
jgi:cytochrome c-type biogenesis protein CcmH/NrfF